MHPRLIKLQERIEKGGRRGNVGMPVFIELATAITEALERLERLEKIIPAMEAYMIQTDRTAEIASVETVLNLSRRLNALEAKVGHFLAVPRGT
jgi:hypothetical protein